MSRHQVAPEPGTDTRTRGMWWTRRAVLLHLTIVVVVPIFVGLFWWQVQRVREGNTLSWAYVFEWPIFTGYALYLWWKLVHDQEASPGRAAVAGRATRAVSATKPFALGRVTAPEVRSVPDGQGAEASDEHDEELEAYNRYLASLHASGRRKRW